MKGWSPFTKKTKIEKIDKNLSDTSASVDTNKGPHMLSGEDLARQYKINKQRKLDELKDKNEARKGTISAPKHVEQAQAAAKLNPVSGPIANIYDFFKNKNK